MRRGGSEAPGKGSGGQFPKRGGPSALFDGGRQQAEDNPWRKAALALDRDRTPAPPREEVDLRARSDGEVEIGRLGAPRGVSGDLRVQSYSGETAHILTLKVVELIREIEGLPPTRLQLRVLRAEDSAGGLTLAFEGYALPEKATLLAGMEILVDRSQAAPLKENEWYTGDLVGLAVVSPDRATNYGRVFAVCEGGSDPWLEVDPGPGTERRLVPFRKEFIGEVNLREGTIELHAPWILE